MTYRTVFQLVITDLQGNMKDLLSIYEDADQANTICEMMNEDFTISRSSRIARVESRRFYYKLH